MNLAILFNEEPIAFNRDLACALGNINETFLVQQMHYWLNINKKKRQNIVDGKVWIYNTYENWQQDHFPFLTIDQIKKAMLRLEKKNIVLSFKPNKKFGKHTKWYTLNYNELSKISQEYLSSKEVDVLELEPFNDKKETVNLKYIECAKSHNVDSAKSHNHRMCQIAQTYTDNTREYQICMYVEEATKQFFTENKKPTKNQIEKIESLKNNINFDLFVELINNAKEKNKSLNYVLGTCTKLIDKNIKTLEDYKLHMEEFKKSFENKSNKNFKSNSCIEKQTKFHNFDETFTKYSSDEFEEIVLTSQNKKFNKEVVGFNEGSEYSDGNKVCYDKAISDNWNVGKFILSRAIEYAQKHNLDYPKK